MDLMESSGLGEDSDARQVLDLLQSALSDGLLTPEALGGAMLAQRAASALGLEIEDLGRTLALQRGLQEGGMAAHEVANAMSMALAMGLQGQKGRGEGRSEQEVKKLLGQALK